MRCYQPPADTRFYAGVDLHARSLFLTVLDRDSQARVARNLPAAPGPYLQAVDSFRDGLCVGCECMHCWYWLADTCRDANTAFALGHAWAMKAVHGQKTKCDRHGSLAWITHGHAMLPCPAQIGRSAQVEQACVPDFEPVLNPG